MSQMLPTRSVDSVRLADVLTSSLAAIHAESNPLALPAVDSVIVLVVDGLGMHNLSARSGHARTLLGGIKRAVLSSTYPATTATALTTLTTGVDSGVHGLTGYSIAARQSGKVFNQLTGWGIDMPPSSWQRATTVFEHAKAADVRADVIAHGKFAGTGFTEAVLRGAEFCASDRLGDRFELAVERSRQRGVIYLYVSELDAIAHRVGWESGEWIAALEDLDAAVRDTLPRLGRRTGMLLTADHGVIDVPAHQHLLIDERAPELLDGVVATAGDPRALTLWLEPGTTDIECRDLARHWQDALGEAVWAASRDEAIELGWFGEKVEADVRERIGDIHLVARKRVALYNTLVASPQSRLMVGQHGGFAQEEQRIPLLGFGAFA